MQQADAPRPLGETLTSRQKWLLLGSLTSIAYRRFAAS
jgi:hypothetical protein